METAQELLNSEFLEDDSQDSNETLELLKFMRDNGTPLNESQIKGMMLLKENDLHDIADIVYQQRRFVTPNNIFFKLIDKLTMADRIKGNAKLSHLMKANSANPAEALKPNDVQAQGMSRREIDKY